MRPAALRVGLFALGALALLVAGVLLVSGRWFAPTEKVQMRFEGSVFGLQPGAPVVLRGVRIGQVTAIGLATTTEAGAREGLAVPVQAELDRSLLAGLSPPGHPAGQPVAPLLVAQGLTARLASQSLLTGLLYVDLDFVRPAGDRPPAGAGMTEIPTRQAPLAALQSQLEGLDIAQVGRDVAAVAAALRRITTEPGATQALARTAAAAESLQTLAARMERDLPPLLASARQAADASRGAIERVAPAAEAAAREVGAAASQARGTAAAGTAALASVQRAAQELQAAAEQVRSLAAEDSALGQDAARALRDVSAAARAMRELAESLERHPEALLRGRSSEAP